MANKSALALLANGSEEMEIVITVDVLRRAGVSIFSVGTKKSKCQSSDLVLIALSTMHYLISNRKKNTNKTNAICLHCFLRC